MVDKNGTAAQAAGPQITEAMRKEYFELLVKLVGGYGDTTGTLQKKLQDVAASRGTIDQGLIDIIKELCNCQAIIVILECLCKFLTGG